MLDHILDRIETLSQQAIQLYRAALFEQAVTPADEAEQLAREHFSDHTVHAETLNTLASLHHQLADFARAEGLYRQALEINRHSIGEHHPEYARNVCNLAVVCQRVGKYGEAESLYQQALDIRRATVGDQSPVYATNLNNLATLYKGQGKYLAAEPLFRQAVDVMRASTGDESSGYARALLALGGFYDAQGNHTKAEPILQQAIAVMRRAVGERHPDYVACLSNLGDLYRAKGKYTEAEEMLQQGGQVLRDIYGATHPTYVANLSRLGSVYYESGDLARAEPFLRQACDLCRQVYGEMHNECAKCLTNLGLLYFQMADLESAERQLRRALEIRLAVLEEHHPDIAQSLCNLARVLDVRGAPQSAEPLYHEALTILRQTVGENDPTYANCLNDLACVYESLNQYEKALPFARQTCAVWSRTHGKEHLRYAASLNNLANLYDSLGRFVEAEAAYREAADILRRVVGEQHPSYAGCLKNLAGVCAALGRLAEALELFRQTQAVDLRMIGNVCAFGSERQRMLYVKSMQDDLFTFISLALSDPALPLAAVGAALDVVLRRKAIGAEILAVQRDTVLEGKYPQLKPMREQLTALRMHIAKLAFASHVEGFQNSGPSAEYATIQMEQLQAELAREVPEMKVQEQLQAVDRHVVAAQLPEGRTLIEFIRFDRHNFKAVPAYGEQRWNESRYVAFVLLSGKPDSVQMIDLGEAMFIDDLIADVRSEVTNCPENRSRDMIRRRAGVIQGENPKPGLALRAAVFDKLTPALGACRRLFIAPDGDLCRLPFEVLPTVDGGYLIDDYEISYLSTGRDVLRFVAAPNCQPSESLVVADPDFDLTGQASTISLGNTCSLGRVSRDQDRSVAHFEPVDRLPGTRAEGRLIAKLLGSPLWLADDAQEGLLKRACRSPHILHLATHGYFLEDQKRDANIESRNVRLGTGPIEVGHGRLATQLQNPLLRSGLILAGFNTWLKQGQLPDEAEDGLLTAEDVSGLDLLDTELVVLSACHTGEGEINVGEGVFGLRRSFVVAGAKTLVMSLWAVPDTQTQELMEDFYRRILSGQPRAEALRGAQLAVKSKYSHPFYWGAFVCQGNPGALSPTV